MTATYPRSAPLVAIKKNTGLLPSHVKELKSLIKRTIKDNKEPAIIFEITSRVQEALDTYEAGTNNESLEDQRLNRIKAEEQKQKDAEEAMRYKHEQDVKEEKRMLDQMVKEELRRRKDKESQANIHIASANSLENTDTSEDVVTFDRPISIRNSNGHLFEFKSVINKIPAKLDFFGKHFIVKPLIKDEVSTDVSLLLSEITIDESYWQTADGTKKIYQLETDLEAVRKLHHANIVPLYASAISRVPSATEWKINLLSETSPMGTVHDLLETVGTVNVKIAKAWAMQLLEALEYIHKSGFPHKSVCTENIVLYRNKELGETQVKLRHVGYGERLTELNQDHPFNQIPIVSSTSQRWQPPELDKTGSSITKKCDIFNFGVAFAEIIAGKNVTLMYETPQEFLDNNDFSQSLKDFFVSMFKPIPKKRSSALDLLTCSFLRLEVDDSSINVLTDKSQSTNGGASGSTVAFRRRSTNRVRRSFSADPKRTVAIQPPMYYSRYAHDFDESSSLGKGAFGEVVKARNKLDGRYYAIKKIHASDSKLNSILQEVWLLSRLNHQYVVRYFGAWLEDDFQIYSDAVAGTSDEDDDSDTETEVSHQLALANSISFYSQSHSKYNGGESMSKPISFLSQSMHGESGIQIEFGDSSNEEEDSYEDDNSTEEQSSSGSEDEEDDDEDETSTALRTKPRQPKTRANMSTLFIQMEYCEKHTLADLIREGLYSKPEEYWRLFRQTLEALNHIHNEGVIHRDLKPMNIFIDQSGNVKVGDFGLAKSIGQNVLMSSTANPSPDGEDLTTEVGTTLYIANEVLMKPSNSAKNGGGVFYDAKVDMYSLGIIFFEMVFQMDTGMERVNTIRGLRTADIRFPQSFLASKYEKEREIIYQLLDHNPAKRPSARELLNSKLVPAPHKDEIVRETLQSIIDTQRDSPWISQVYSALFSKKLDGASAVLYDKFKFSNLKTTTDHLLHSKMVELITEVFKRHGAIEIDERAPIFPCSSYYDSPSVVKLMDTTGNILQMPFDLTLPFASKVAERPPPFQKCFDFGYVYRADEKQKGTMPRKYHEICFDIVSSGSANSDLYEAEVIKVLDEVINIFPGFKQESIAIYINHVSVLDAILRHCSFRDHQWASALMLLGQSGVGPAQQNIKQELLAEFSLSSTALNELELFGFRDFVDKAEARLLKLMGDTDLGKSFKDGIANIRAVITYLGELGITKRVYFAPLSNYNPRFYKGGIMFQVVYEEKKRLLLAAGGRYDHLIKSLSHMSLQQGPPARGVGFTMPLDRLMDYLLGYREQSLRKSKKSSNKFLKKSVQQGAALPSALMSPSRCDVLITSFKGSATEKLCLNITRELWSHKIRTDYVRGCVSSEELMAIAEKDHINCVVIVKQQSSYSSANFRPLRIKTLEPRNDFDLAVDELIPFLLNMISERERSRPVTLGGGGGGGAMLAKYAATGEATGGHGTGNEESDDGSVSGGGAVSAPSSVVILNESGKLKGGKKNRWLLEQTASEKTQEFVRKLGAAPVYSLDVKDETMEAITLTSPHQPDEWKRRVVGTSPNQKWYLLDIQAALAKEALRNTEAVLLYSTKTGKTCIYNLQQR